MNLIVCVDDRYGMSFNNRRQSRDLYLLLDILATVGSNTLLIEEYSRKLFSPIWSSQIQVDSLKDVCGDVYWFRELSFPDPAPEFEKIVLYRWNRMYPASVYFPVAILSGYERVSVQDFEGKSHEKISKEVYVK